MSTPRDALDPRSAEAVLRAPERPAPQLPERAPLAPGAERELVLRAQAGEVTARAQLVEALLPLIDGVARTYRSSPAVDRQELLQEGVVGLLRALERYEPDRGVPFWAYAAWWVRQAMQQLVAELTGPVVLSDRAIRHLARLKEAHADALHEHGREPGRDELVQRSGLSPDQVDDLLATQRAPRSLEAGHEGAAGEIGTFGDLLADPLAEDAYEEVLAEIESTTVLGLLAELSPRERTVLRARYGLDGEPVQSLRDLGGDLGVSGERVRRIEQRALGKLRAAAAR